jgi:hypothetical protein
MEKKIGNDKSVHSSQRATPWDPISAQLWRGVRSAIHVIEL